MSFGSLFRVRNNDVANGSEKRRSEKWLPRAAQSLVEFAILLPILILLLTGLTEFGFMMNAYLNLLDGTREAARLFANFTPFENPPYDSFVECSSCQYDASNQCTASTYTDANGDLECFYISATTTVMTKIAPVELNSNTDDVIVSVFSIDSSGNVQRFPSGSGEWRQFNNRASRFCVAPAGNSCPDPESNNIRDMLPAGAPPTGAILVEVFYQYEHVLKIPWFTIFVPDPTTLYAYSFMPLSAAEPTPTPSP